MNGTSSYSCALMITHNRLVVIYQCPSILIGFSPFTWFIYINKTNVKTNVSLWRPSIFLSSFVLYWLIGGLESIPTKLTPHSQLVTISSHCTRLIYTDKPTDILKANVFTPVLTFHPLKFREHLIDEGNCDAEPSLLSPRWVTSHHNETQHAKTNR